MSLFRAVLLGCTAIVPLSAAQAQDAPASPVHQGAGDDFHGDIVVRAAGVGELDLLAGTSVLEGEELQANMDGQVGEVLAKLPGVSASGFAPGASRPILRGFGGERVRVLTDGVGAIDASSTSDDHAVSVDPLIVSRIDVLRGPAVLLYGSQAIGGAVNVITKRIPPAVPNEPIHIDASAAFDTAYDRREGGLSVDVPLGDNVAFHVDGNYRKTGDVDIPGYVASEHLREHLLEAVAEETEEGHLDEAEEFQESADARGTLPNSFTETYSLGTGIAFFSGDSKLGVSFGYYDTNYGIPGLHGIGHVHDHEEEEGDHDHEDEAAEDHHDEEGGVSIGMKKYRVDLEGVLDLGDGFFDEVRTNWGYSDYTHTEFEGDEVGTVFDVEGVEGRVELVQSLRGGWQGSVGAQYSHENFQAIGEEAFVPPSKTDRMAVFTLQEVNFDPVQLEFGGRFEHTDIDADTIGQSRNFDTFSAAVGASYELANNLRIGINGSRAERAPSTQELFADGPHVATQQYELGNPDLDPEGAWGIEGYLRGQLGLATISLGIYQNWFDGFIYLSDTGEEEDGLPALQFLQDDATHFGIEGKVSAPLYSGDGFTVRADVTGDYVRASLTDGSPVPRIPPLSLTGGVEAEIGPIDARAEVEWYDKQDRLADNEEPTDGFTFVNLSLAWHPLPSDNFTLMLQADNIFDQEGRRHTSFTKEYVPLAGRNFKLSARASF